jgi:subtilisin family serine protease
MKLHLKFIFTNLVFATVAAATATATATATTAFAAATAPRTPREYLIEMTRPLTNAEVQKYKNIWQGQIEIFDNTKSAYFQRLYRVKSPAHLDVIRSSRIVKKIETIESFKTFSVEPGSTTSKYTNDPLIAYQWGFENTEQVVTQDIDDITLKRVKGVRHADIDLPAAGVIEKYMKRDVIVAVIDTGVDVDHPDIKENIYINETECINGEIPLNPKEDKDGNGLKGDCKGWSFTGKDKDGLNRTIDDVGHGTHVAGIISATTNNSTGISGITNKIKILPIKVLSDDPERKNGIGLTDRLAKGILYAAKMNVDVINLSLGWPLALDKKYLREALNEALSKNIVIVAAAGNNSHSASILPCAIEGVLCVGSVDNDLAISSSSNFGLHVDVLAPGDNILSLYPMNLSPDLFSVQGYDYKSGTSQAAPYVAGLAGVLKGHSSQDKAIDIRNRIILSTTPLKFQKKNFLAGLISFTKAINASANGKLVPQLKEKDRYIIDSKQTSIDLELSLYNPTLATMTSPISVKSLATHVEVTQTQNKITVAAKGSATLKTKLNVLNLRGSSEVQIEYTIDKDVYRQKITLSRNIDGLSQVTHLSIPQIETPNLLTLTFRHKSPNTPYYYDFKIDETASTIRVFKPDMATKSIKTFGQIEITNLKDLASFSSLDFDNDGQLDYQVIALTEKDEKQKIEYFVYDQNLKIKYSKPIELEVEQVLQIDTELGYLYKTINGNSYAMPIFLTEGPAPKRDQPKDAFAPRDTRSVTHLYYFEPIVSASGDIQYVTRIIDSIDRIKAWKKALQLRAFSDIRILHLLPQSENQLNKNTVQFLVSHGYDFDRTHSIVTATVGSNGEIMFDWAPQETSQRVLDGYYLDSAINLTNIKKTETTLIGPLQTNQWEKVSFLENSNTSTASQLRSSDLSEVINTYVKGYLRNSTRYSFLQTISEILLTVEDNGRVQNFIHPFHVSTFLPGNLFLERGFPLWFGEQNRDPALYIDASQIVSRNAYLLIGNDRGISAPILTNINVPENCITMNPSHWGNAVYNFTLLCKSETGWQLQLLPMTE